MSDVKKIIESDKDFSAYPYIHQYDNAAEEALWVLEVASNEFGIERLAASDISLILVEKFEISRSSRAIGSALGKAAKKGLVNKSGQNGLFKIMKTGRDLLYQNSLSDPSVTYIESGKPFTGRLILFREILQKIQEKIWICDPYIGSKLLDRLHELDRDIEIRILTKQVQNRQAFNSSLADFIREHPTTEVKEGAGDIHDRYVISKNTAWLVGHSLKDLGTKESFIVKLGEDTKTIIERAFEERWNQSHPLS